ncbi:MAG: hypothetical protein U0694_29430 [Anaerolineae bacterium]
MELEIANNAGSITHSCSGNAYEPYPCGQKSVLYIRLWLTSYSLSLKSGGSNNERHRPL